MVPTLNQAATVAEQDFRQALRHFASGVTIITTQDQAGTIHGMTATAFSSLSLTPPLILVAVAQATRCHAMITATGRFGVSVLYDDQADLSRHFGGQASPGVIPRFDLLEGTPVIEGAMITLACSLEQAIEGGDHTIFVGLVAAAATVPGKPLIHFDGRYRTLAPVE
ncbi:flavin reductase family protein [Beijerinckia sp. L45]|uniref:flavin reductase family protein n=1 Tax=Beijerinckia sp. L45 TaxID=1641855 RepID=UPI00131DE60F|nr:flavin reductase family protein [Beijerinckia sp. L45]